MTVLLCRIELNKEKGLLLTVENAEGKITQTAVFDGTKITTTVKGSENTSTITQDADGVTIKCKAFTVDADTVTVKSKEDSVYKSEKKLSVESKEDMSLKSSTAKLTASASTDFSASGNSFTGSATQAMKLDGMTSEVKATDKVSLSGANIEGKATVKFDVSGVQVKVASSGTLDLEGQMSTLKGSIAKISAPMVKLG